MRKFPFNHGAAKILSFCTRRMRAPISLFSKKGVWGPAPMAKNGP